MMTTSFAEDRPSVNVGTAGPGPEAGRAASTGPVPVSDDGTMSSTATSDESGGSSADAWALADSKGARSIAVCVPARNEAATVGPIVESIVHDLTDRTGGAPLVDEVVVVDDGSDDGTAQLARRAGARVVGSDTRAGGKGQAMRAALAATDADLIVFVDGDITNFGPHFVTGLLGPLLVDDSVTLVKGYYERPIHGSPDGGGRVTELMARPVIDLLFPHLAGIEQPLAGETAAPRRVLERCGLADGYAVELALLIDVASLYGVASIAQVDLGVRVHRNRPLAELRPQATDILAAALARARLITPD
jgi:glucosyl-3-phosphoglycerate synthase